MNLHHRAASALSGRFLKEVETRPDAIAIITDDTHVSFRELGAMVAAAQQQLRATKAQTIGLYSPPSTSLISAAWAALCSGIPYVPLSPTYPDERLRYMVRDSGVDTIVAPSSLHDEVRAIVGDLNILVIDVPSVDEPCLPEVSSNDDALAYVLYTSGSTGTPKGVEVSHSALAHQLMWLDTTLDLGHAARIVHKTPISFDASQWELLANGNGATTIVGGPEVYRDPQALVETVISHGATHLQAVPTLLQALCEEADFAHCTSLQIVASGGEVLTARLAESLQAILPDTTIINLYGPTETTINASHHVFGAPSSSAGNGPAVPIGKPVSGLTFHLLDEAGEPTDSATGELAIAGPQLARGYRNRPEETRQRFLTRVIDDVPVRLYRTGDVVERINETYHFRGRMDSQVKIRGHRIELGEVRSTLENHPWVRHAEVLTTTTASGTANRMIAYVELNPSEAALMDQGVHGSHHESKGGRLQVRAQVAGLGIREDHTASGVTLPITADNDRILRELAFARKTYRTFHSTTTDVAQLTELTALISAPKEWAQSFTGEWSLDSLAFVLRSLVQYHSGSRLLPKYAYASPGALYGVQVYVSITGVSGLDDGVYYLNPKTATLHLITTSVTDSGDGPNVEIILVGQRSVISSVYKTNVDEVLLFETGHLLGALDTVVPASGYRLGERRDGAQHASVLIAGEEDDRFIIGTWPLISVQSGKSDPLEGVSHLVELLKGGEASRGVYQQVEGQLSRVSSSPLIRRKDVIAINQRVHKQASFGLILTSSRTRESYIDLGRALQRAEMNNLGLGLMSSGYSSFSGHDLATARRINAFASNGEQSSYFAIGGPITAAQIAHTGMDEDLLHTQGPAEIITSDIGELLPSYMVPDSVRIVDRLPRTPNGKIDAQALREAEDLTEDDVSGENHVAPGSFLEHQLEQIWRDTLNHDGPVSVAASFFALGGTSIAAVRLVRAIRSRLGVDLPIQAVFEYDTIVKQSEAVQSGGASELSRVVPLAGTGDRPMFMWPGLGGYPMNLRSLAELVAGTDHRCYGIQAHGLNDGEEIDTSIQSMAARDIDHLRRLHPQGPYTLIGYSFGARVALEAAHQLQQAGDVVDRVILLAPGSPVIVDPQINVEAEGPYRDSRFTRVLYSVFFSRTDGPHADRVVAAAKDRTSFLAAIEDELPMDTGLAERIVLLVEKTHSFTYTLTELTDRTVVAPLTIIRAKGDDYSFLDTVAAHVNHRDIELNANHYQILQHPEVKVTAEAVNAVLTGPQMITYRKNRTAMPHVLVKHFPTNLSEDSREQLVDQLVSLVSHTFKVSATAVSISLEPVSQDDWMTEVYQPEIVKRKDLLVKNPGYGAVAGSVQ